MFRPTWRQAEVARLWTLGVVDLPLNKIARAVDCCAVAGAMTTALGEYFLSYSTSSSLNLARVKTMHRFALVRIIRQPPSWLG